VCPTETILTLDGEGPRAVRWGLVPSYTKQVGKGPALINARLETVATKSPFAKLLARPERRCLVLADGWYEWLKAEKKGQQRLPFRYTVDEGSVFAFAGVYDGTGVAILTTEANEICAPVHDRMPVVLDGPEAEAMWLSADVDVPEAEALLLPFPSERVSVAPANPAVNRAGVEGPELLTPPDAPVAPPSDTLF
jgi:putative SOS response-associated peptidase YedK